MFSEIISKLPTAMVFVATGQDFISYANKAALQLFAPCSLENVIFRKLLVDDEQREIFDAFVVNGGESKEFTFTGASSGHVDDAENRDTTITAIVIRSPVSDGCAYHIRPVEYSDESKQWPVALFDALTTLPNRELLRDRMEQAIHAASRLDNAFLGILFIDLDRFKEVNDTYGHAAGDAVLVEVATRLRGCIRESDTVARLGGDEFVVLVCNLRDMEENAIVAERILKACARPIVVGENVFQISASVGVAAWPTDGLTVDELIHNADMAMYSSKGEGRNKLRFFDVQMNERVKLRTKIEADLKVALKEGHFVLHYQPQFCSSLNRIVGAEALIRWNHPTLGLVQPASFIRVAEESNLITPIGDWVLSEAVQQGRRWQDMGLNLRVAVNLSGRQFDDSLPGRVSEVLAKADFPAALLELELTESFLVSDVAKAARILRALRDLGVRVALDDFGTGWSSLNYLKNFPVDTLKIDRSFIGSKASEFDERIIRAILSIAREFNLSTLAEGVETDEQLALLHALGCDAWQGFLLSSAITADAFPDFYRVTALAGNRFATLPGDS